MRVYLLDDHDVVREGLRFLLERHDIEVVGESGTAAEAAARIPALRPDVAVLDARLPDGSGIEVCRAVRSVDPGMSPAMQMPLIPRSRSIGSMSVRMAPVSAAVRTSTVTADSMRSWLSRNSSESMPIMAFSAVAIPLLRAT